MEKVRVLEIKQSVFANNDAQAEKLRSELKEKGIYLLTLMSSPGSGKTTFIKSVCEELGVEDTINSPTFAIVNEYESRDADTIFHFDFYRIKSLAEVYNMGYEEYFYGNAYSFIEWPELIEELLPEEHVRVDITEGADGARTIKVTIND